jgi:hypothetical protein
MKELETSKGEEKMQGLNFQRRVPAPDEIHSGLMFNEYRPEGRVITMKDIVLATIGVLILLVAYCIVGYMEIGA